MIYDTLNTLLIDKIKNYLMQSGYNYEYFVSLYDDSVEINSMDYIINLKDIKKINLNEVIKCLSSVFNVNKAFLKKNSDRVELTYKRVSNFHKMNSIMSFITMSKKINLNAIEIIERLQDNFQLSEDEAKKKLLDWKNEVDVRLSLNENSKIDIESNPGFEVIIKSNELNTNTQKMGTSVIINDINDIKYIKFLKTYINSLLIMVFKNELLDKDKFKNICKGARLKDIKEISDIKADKEENIVNDGKINFKKDTEEEDDEETMDAFFQFDSDDEDDEIDINSRPINVDDIMKK